jgi:HD-GYP domain-containing protein (c-di-GMP phosphodiesterase class II)
MKLEKKRINQNFLPLFVDDIAVDSVISFDIYIKKLNDFVVIIEAHTKITAALKAKLANSKVYIQKTMLSEFQNYRQTFHQESKPQESAVALNHDDLDKQFRHLKRIMTTHHSSKEKVQTLLECGYALMKACFLASHDTLYVEHINTLAKTFKSILKDSDISIKQFVALMKNSSDNEVHACNVAILGLYLANILQYSEDDLIRVFKVGLLHDIGNKLIDPSLLNGHGKLTPQEFETIQEHVNFGVQISKAAGVEDQAILDGILYHHESLNGKGYPSGAKGVAIPKIAQIIGLCDVFNALTMERSYRGSFSSFHALKIIKLEMKHQFNITHINMLIKMLH